MKQKNSKKLVLKGALILSVASLIAKVLSAFYRIPFENLVGNTGFYVYQQIYPIYGIGMTFALSGFPVFISKLIAEQPSEEEKLALSRQMFAILMVFSLVIFLGLRFFKHLIAQAMGDPALEILIANVAWMFLLMPFLAVGRGYYQGKFNMVPTAISQVSEQLVRVLVILLAALLFVQRQWSVYQMGAYAMLGATIGGLVAGLSFGRFYLRDFFKYPGTQIKLNAQTLVKRLASEGVIICLFASLMVLLQLVDSFTVKQALQAGGMFDEMAKEVKGTYDRAQPLVQLGLVVAVSFSSTLLPALTKSLQAKRMIEFRWTAKALLRISLGIGTAATVGLMLLMPQINTLLFGDANQSKTIAVYVFSVVLVTVISAYNSILQSLNQYRSTVVALIVAIFVKWLLNSYLILRLGIMGASVATILGLAAGLVVIMLALPVEVTGLLTENNYLIKLVLTTLTMIITTGCWIWCLNYFFNLTRLAVLVELLLAVPVGVVSFVLAAVAFKLFTLREWLVIPGGRKFIRLLSKINLSL